MGGSKFVDVDGLLKNVAGMEEIDAKGRIAIRPQGLFLAETDFPVLIVVHVFQHVGQSSAWGLKGLLGPGEGEAGDVVEVNLGGFRRAEEPARERKWQKEDERASQHLRKRERKREKIQLKIGKMQ